MCCGSTIVLYFVQNWTKYSTNVLPQHIFFNRVVMSSRGWHSNTSCTLKCDLSQNFDRKILSWYCIDFTIVSFTAKILLDLDQHDRIISKRYSGLTVDYGEHFKLTVDIYFDRGRRSEYRMCWTTTPLCLACSYSVDSGHILVSCTYSVNVDSDHVVVPCCYSVDSDHVVMSCSYSVDSDHVVLSCNFNVDSGHVYN